MIPRILALLFIPLAAYGSPSRAKLAPDNEPGQRMVITGHVFGSDGKPIGGVQIEAYHTDANGNYRLDDRYPEEPARLHRTLVTAADGSYQIETIRPAPYPHRSVPAHIHFRLLGHGFDRRETWNLPKLPPNGLLRLTHDFHVH
jgi:protocatechuate 3,4-dioxygenase beta subunit